MFFQISTAPNLECGSIDMDADCEYSCVHLLRGNKLDEARYSKPWKFTVTRNPDFPLIMNAYYPEYGLFAEEMVAALHDAGASNLQVFPAEIRISGTGQILRNYSVINIVGLVACAIVSRSESTELADERYFYRLVIDPAAASGAAIFRLRESRLVVIVNAALAAALQTRRLPNLLLEPVSP